MTNKVIFLVAAGCAIAAAPASAKKTKVVANDAIVEALARCGAIQAADQRLACYDQAGPKLVAASKNGDIKVVDRASVRRAQRGLFGFSLPSLSFLDEDEGKEDPRPKRLETTIVGAKALPGGFYRITIADDGAVWDTTEATLTRDPKKGEKVVIERTGIGSYFAKIGNNRDVRVRRVR